jgi:hypothetical protein
MLMWIVLTRQFREKMIIPGGMGACAFFLDSEKNVMGLWSEK